MYELAVGNYWINDCREDSTDGSQYVSAGRFSLSQGQSFFLAPHWTHDMFLQIVKIVEAGVLKEMTLEKEVILTLKEEEEEMERRNLTDYAY